MAKPVNQGWCCGSLFRVFWAWGGVIALGVGFFGSGCGQLNEYMGRPVVIDASRPRSSQRSATDYYRKRTDSPGQSGYADEYRPNQRAQDRSFSRDNRGNYPNRPVVHNDSLGRGNSQQPRTGFGSEYQRGANVTNAGNQGSYTGRSQGRVYPTGTDGSGYNSGYGEQATNRGDSGYRRVQEQPRVQGQQRVPEQQMDRPRVQSSGWQNRAPRAEPTNPIERSFGNGDYNRQYQGQVVEPGAQRPRQNPNINYQQGQGYQDAGTRAAPVQDVYGGQVENYQMAPGQQQQRPAQGVAGAPAGYNQGGAVRQGPAVSELSISGLGETTASAPAPYNRNNIPVDSAWNASPAVQNQQQRRDQRISVPSGTALAPGTGAGVYSGNNRPGVSVESVGELPGITVPAIPGRSRSNLTQPAVSTQPSGMGVGRYGIEDATARLERMIIENPQNVDAKLALHYLYLSQGQKAQAATVLPGDPETANRSMASLAKLKKVIATKADLFISQLKVCSKVKGFGQYEEVSQAELEKGQARQMLVYCELSNFKTRQDSEGKYLAELHVEVALEEAETFKIIKQRSVDVLDTPSFSRRQDFFLHVLLDVPPLEPGKYRLTMRMEDKIGKNMALPKHIYFEVKPFYQRSF